MSQTTYRGHHPESMDMKFVKISTLQPHYNAPHYNTVFNIMWPYHGSQIDYFTICLEKVTSLLHGSLITRSVSMAPKDSVIMRLTCMLHSNTHLNCQSLPLMLSRMIFPKAIIR